MSTHFPPLGFDLNLLEGQDAWDKYRQCGPIRGVVELVGMPKADAFLAQRNTCPRVTRVAVACNTLDETEAIAATLAYLLQEFPDLEFTFRPHPGDARDFSFLRAQHPRLQFSDARHQNVFEFLGEHDALIAADTSTHLEATLLNLVSLYFRFGTHGLTQDYYGYVAHGLAEPASTLPELGALLARFRHQKPPDTYRRAVYYNATLGTPDEGRSQQRAVRLLQEWLPSAQQ